MQIKVRYSDFQTITRATTLPVPTDITDEIWCAAADLLKNRLPHRALRIRLVGVAVSGLTGGGAAQATLFPDVSRDAHSRLDRTVDQLRERFGRGALSRGSDLQRQPPDRTRRER